MGLQQFSSQIVSSSPQPSLPPEEMTFATRSPNQPMQSQEEQGNVSPTSQWPEKPLEDTITAVISTSKGDIHVLLYGASTPKTVRNFISKAESNFYRELTFHRVEDWVLQGGDPKGDGTGGGNSPVEFTEKPFRTGSLGVASRGDGVNQNDAQFFITKRDAEWLNGKYTNFGEVIEGMDIVNSMVIGDKILSIAIK